MFKEWPKDQQILILILVGVGLVAALFLYFQKPQFADQSITLNGQPFSVPATLTAETILVHVSGLVKREGLYRLAAGDRLADLLRLAGVEERLADLSAVNLAQVLKDGEKIVLPAKKRLVSAGEDPEFETRGKNSTSPVNVNTAGEKELCSLDGIGPTMAKKIIAYRRSNGPFADAAALAKVPRLGKKKVAALGSRLLF